MSRTTTSKYLPTILQTIEERRLEGVLVGNLSPRRSVQLFFRQGQLIYIWGNQTEQTPDELLHEVLSGVEFELNWQPLQVRFGQNNINAETRQALQDVLPIFIEGGNFLPTTAVLTEGFFGVAQPKVAEVEPVAIEILPPISTAVPPPAAKAVPPARFYETNLLLPPGQRQDQLEELLSAVSFKEQVVSLSQAHFTGYAYYNNPAQQSDWGLVLFWQGRITDVIYQGQSANRQTGPAAQQTLQKISLVPEIYRVEERVLKAYRGVVACDRPQTNIAANKVNFNSLVTAFRQSGRDGVIILYVDKLKLHYFFLFEGGANVGLFAPESKSGRLAPLAAPLALPGSDQASHFTVLPANKLSSPVLSARPATVTNLTAPAQFQFEPGAANLPTIAETETVDWNGILQQMAQPKTPAEAPTKKASKETGPYQPDLANPFDF